MFCLHFKTALPFRADLIIIYLFAKQTVVSRIFFERGTLFSFLFYFYLATLFFRQMARCWNNFCETLPTKSTTLHNTPRPLNLTPKGCVVLPWAHNIFDYKTFYVFDFFRKVITFLLCEHILVIGFVCGRNASIKKYQSEEMSWIETRTSLVVDFRSGRLHSFWSTMVQF